MTDPPTTQVSLLIRLRDADDTGAWQHFVQLYGPLIYRYARKHHLQHADAADVTQDVFQAVSQAIEGLEYDPERGSFRGWLFTLAHHRLCDFFTRRKRQVQGSGNSDVQALLQDVPGPQEDLWEKEYELQLFHWAAEQIRNEFADKTWQAFWQTAVDGKPISETAEALGLSVGAIYVYRTRVQGRLKEKLQEARGD